MAQEEVENAVTRLVENQSRLASLTQSASHGRAALAIANARFAAGTSSYQSVLENQRTLHAIRRAALQPETASYVVEIALYQALGWGTALGCPGRVGKFSCCSMRCSESVPCKKISENHVWQAVQLASWHTVNPVKCDALHVLMEL